jgi:hypothetical protein
MSVCTGAFLLAGTGFSMVARALHEAARYFAEEAAEQTVFNLEYV